MHIPAHFTKIPSPKSIGSSWNHGFCSSLAVIPNDIITLQFLWTFRYDKPGQLAKTVRAWWDFGDDNFMIETFQTPCLAS